MCGGGRCSHTCIQPPQQSTSCQAGTRAPEVLGVPLPHIRLAVSHLTRYICLWPGQEYAPGLMMFRVPSSALERKRSGDQYLFLSHAHAEAILHTQVTYSSVSHAIAVVMNRAHITLIRIPGQPDLRLLHFPGLPLLPHWGYARNRVLQAIPTNPFEDRKQLTSATASRSHCNGPDYNLLAGLHV
jgi:hypothetical protein